jgi:Tol biopolymer transport system component
VPGDTNGVPDIFVYDVVTETIERISVDSNGNQGNAWSGNNSSISDYGRYVSFESRADNLVPGDTNGVSDIFVRDRF